MTPYFIPTAVAAIITPFAGGLTTTDYGRNGVSKSTQDMRTSPLISLLYISIGRLRELSLYEEGWFRETSQAATRQTIDDAEIFLRNYDFKNASPPYIALAEDGEINFLWKSKNFHFDLGFCGDGTYNYYGKTSDNTEFLGEFPVNKPLNADILKHLTSQNDLKTRS